MLFELILLGLGLYLLFPIGLYLVCCWVIPAPSRIKINGDESSDQRVLIVTAHPDDECMFFSPTIQGFNRLGLKVHLLCLTPGNYYGDGKVREKELFESCKYLDIPKSCVTLINDEKLRDDPDVLWNKDSVGQIILSCVKDNNIDIIVTFDDLGVSRHNNHISVFHATRELYRNLDLPRGTCVYNLATVNTLRKYRSVLDLPSALLDTKKSRGLMFISNPGLVLRAQRAMFQHRSQLQWFRILYIIFSRYMVMNTLYVVNG